MIEALKKMSQETPTEYWIDTCDEEAVQYAVERGAVGATTNPVIVKQVLEQNLAKYTPRIRELIVKYPQANEDVLAWMMIEELATKGASYFQKVFDPQKGKGRLSIQTDPKNYNNAEAIVAQAEKFAKLAPNIQVKIPVTQAGVEAIEEATYRGISINATVSFTVAQAVSVAKAVERGLERRKAEGKVTENINPVCTIMVGRCDDWLKTEVNNLQRVSMIKGSLDLAGVAIFKEAYRIFKKREYTTKLLAAAYRNYHHWLDFIGGEVIETISYKWQRLFNDFPSNLVEDNKMQDALPQEWIDNWLSLIPEFRKMYREDGMTTEDFNSFGPVTATLHQFLEGYADLAKIIRGIMIS